MEKIKRTEIYMLSDKKDRCVVTIVALRYFRDGYYPMI